jgi:putative transposase
MSAKVLTPIIKEYWADEKVWGKGNPFPKAPGFSSVARWKRQYEVADRDIRALIDRTEDQGHGGSRLVAKVEQFIEDAIQTIYLTLERNTIAAVRDSVRESVAKENIERLATERLSAPSFDAIKKRINHIPAYDRWVARYGKRLADIKFRAAMGGPFAAKPLARACMDHCRMDLMVVDDATGLPLGRPWLTLVMDEATRYILGFYLGFEEPSNVSVMRALKHALSPKDDELARFPEIKHGWDAWGPMEVLVVDNGLEFHGHTIRKGSERFGITMQYCPRRKPWYKGKIERFFGTLGTLLAGIPGKTFSSVVDKHDYDPSKHAIVRLSTLREIVLTWIVDVYHERLHKGLGRSPGEAWHADIRTVDRWLPNHNLHLESAFSKSETRRLTHKGIELDSLLYNSADLRSVREEFGDNLEVEVRCMDDDLGSVVVVAPDGTLVRVPALDEAYATGLTRWQHGVCRRYQRRLQDNEERVISLGEAKGRIRLLIQRDRKLIDRSSRKKQARFEESGTSPASVAAAAPPAAPDAAALAPPVPTPLPIVTLPKPAASVAPAPAPDPDDGDDDEIPDFAARNLANHRRNDHGSSAPQA